MGSDNVLTQPAAGGTVPRTPEEAALVRGAFGTPEVSQEARDAASREADLRSQLGNEGLSTFAEGIADAVSLGEFRETGDLADMRREENRGPQIAGNILGTIIALETGAGPGKLTAEAGELAGKFAARGLLRRAEGSIAERVLGEAGAGAALTGATAFNHQLMDSVIEDRDFSSAAILDEAKLGAIIGGIGGGVQGIFGKVATRAEVSAQGGLIGDTALATKHFDDAFRAYDDVLQNHQIQVGALRELQSNGRLGPVSDAFMDVRKVALRDAERAQAAFKELDHEVALSGRDPDAYATWQTRAQAYRKSVRDLDGIMRPDKAEIGADAAFRQSTADTMVDLAPRGKLVEPGTPTGAKYGGDPYLDEFFATAPEMRLRYEKIYGRPYEPNARAPGGVVTPTSELGTNVGGGAPVQPAGSLDDLNRLVAASPEESAARTMHAAEHGPTMLESMPRGAAQGALDRAAAAADRAAQRAPTRVEASPFGAGETPTMVDQAPAGAQDAAMDAWLKAPRVRPFDEAEARVRSAMEDLYKASGGRLDSAGSLTVLERAGLKRSADPVVAHADALWSMRHAARLAADEARGVATPLRDAAKDAMKAAMGGISRRIMGGIMGHAIGGPIGGAMGMLGFSGRLGAASGRLLGEAVSAAGKLLTSTRLRAVTVAAGNRAWAYSDRGPIADPVERIQELQFLAGNPDAVRARVAATSGTLGHVAPELMAALQNQAVTQVMRLSMRAPAIYYDRLGNPLMPPAGKMREFYEYENAVHDLPSLLDALGNGSLTRPQAAALQESWAPVHLRIAQAFLQDPAKLQSLGRAQLRVVEMVTGLSLTGASDPMFLARQMQAWAPIDNPEQQAPQKPQSFNINPTGAPTPSQANATGRAPGN